MVRYDFEENIEPFTCDIFFLERFCQNFNYKCQKHRPRLYEGGYFCPL